MGQRHVHYESAFEDYLRSVGRPFIAIDEAKRSVFSGARIKSFDFLVYSSGPTHWLVDVKGRKVNFPGPRSRGHLENWTTREDVVGLRQWAEVFGEGFEGLLVFVYWLTDPARAAPCPGPVHRYGGRQYILAATTVQWYAGHLRDRSRRWGTVSVPAAIFRQGLRSIDEFL